MNKISSFTQLSTIKDGLHSIRTYVQNPMLKKVLYREFSTTVPNVFGLASLISIFACGVLKLKSQYFTDLCSRELLDRPGILQNYSVSICQLDPSLSYKVSVSVITGIVLGLALGIVGLIIRELAAIPKWKGYDALFHNSRHKQAVLVLTASDAGWNGSIGRWSDSRFKNLQRLSEQYALFRRTVSSIEDVNSAIKEVRKTNKSIVLLCINAHGDRNTMTFSKVCGKRELRNIRFDLLDPKANILLESCSVAAKGPTLNVAETIALAAGPRRTVIASPFAITSDEVQLIDVSKRTFAIYSPKQNVALSLSYEKAKRKAQLELSKKCREFSKKSCGARFWKCLRQLNHLVSFALNSLRI